eukprot:1583600-Rhodomonas_salina.1
MSTKGLTCMDLGTTSPDALKRNCTHQKEQGNQRKRSRCRAASENGRIASENQGVARTNGSTASVNGMITSVNSGIASINGSKASLNGSAPGPFRPTECWSPPQRTPATPHAR